MFTELLFVPLGVTCLIWSLVFYVTMESGESEWRFQDAAFKAGVALTAAVWAFYMACASVAGAL